MSNSFRKRGGPWVWSVRLSVEFGGTKVKSSLSLGGIAGPISAPTAQEIGSLRSAARIFERRCACPSLSSFRGRRWPGEATASLAGHAPRASELLAFSGHLRPFLKGVAMFRASSAQIRGCLRFLMRALCVLGLLMSLSSLASAADQPRPSPKLNDIIQAMEANGERAGAVSIHWREVVH